MKGGRKGIIYLRTTYFKRDTTIVITTLQRLGGEDVGTTVKDSLGSVEEGLTVGGIFKALPDLTEDGRRSTIRHDLDVEMLDVL